MHTSVFLEESIEQLAVKEGGVYIDATFGEGGHAREIVQRGGMVIAFEWDDQTYQVKSEEMKAEDKIRLVNECFADIEKVMDTMELKGKVDGILFDLGLSMRQIRQSGRGFSYREMSEPLDMRINSSLTMTAADVVNSYSAQNLYEIFAKYSEEVHSRAISQIIVSTRRMKMIQTVGDLVKAVKSQPGAGDSTVARIFQALRMEVNHEEENLSQALEGSLDVLVSGGRIVLITFHGGEDRIVKRFVHRHGLALKSIKKIKKTDRKSFERSAQLRVIHA